MAYWLWFWRSAASGGPDAELLTRLRAGDWSCVTQADEVMHFRRDLIASDPDWTRMELLPNPGSTQPQDRYLAIVFPQEPLEDQVRDLRYVAARNRLTMYDPQVGPDD